MEVKKTLLIKTKWTYIVKQLSHFINHVKNLGTLPCYQNLVHRIFLECTLLFKVKEVYSFIHGLVL